jgi:hypothetical protein
MSFCSRAPLVAVAVEQIDDAVDSTPSSSTVTGSSR